MMGTTETGNGAPGKEDSPAGAAEVDGSEADESGYRRDDYWREEADENTTPGTEAEPGSGFAFESVEERVTSERPDGDSGGKSDAAREQGNAGGRDDANIVEKG